MRVLLFITFFIFTIEAEDPIQRTQKIFNVIKFPVSLLSQLFSKDTKNSHLINRTIFAVLHHTMEPVTQGKKRKIFKLC